MPWYIHALLVLAPLVAIAGVFLTLHLLTRLAGIPGYAPGWRLRCTRCDQTRDAGEAGVIRLRAASAGKRTFGYCRHCYGLRWLAVEHQAADA